MQLGFVFNTLTSAILGLDDSFDPRHFFMLSGLAATAANAAILGVDPTGNTIILRRFVTGA